MTYDYNNLLHRIQELGKTLKSVAGKVEDIGVSKQWLTEHDLAVEKALVEEISKFSGEQQIFAEELHADFREGESVWVIDPISSTSNFIHGLPHYAIVLSHVLKGRVVFAAIYDPSMDEIFTAELGKGTQLNGEAVKVKDAEDIFALVPIYPNPSWDLEKCLEQARTLLPLASIKNIGSFGLHYAYVACGRVQAAIHICKDAFPEFAGKLLVEEAGGKFTDFAGLELGIATKHVIAASPETYGKLQPLLSNLVN